MRFFGIFGLVLAAQLVSAHYNSTGNKIQQHFDAYNKQGAVASENAVCSRIGIDLLQAGGNAADAVSDSVLRCLFILEASNPPHGTDYRFCKQLVGTIFCVGLISAFFIG